MSEWDHLPDSELARHWDEARHFLLETSVAGLSLRAFASRVGLGWSYLRGDDELRGLLLLSWTELQELHGFGRVKLGLLFECVVRGAAMPVETADKAEEKTLVAEPVEAQLDVSTSLSLLGIERATPLDLMFVSARAHSLLERECLKDVGTVLDFLAREDMRSLRERDGVGGGTAQELLGCLAAVCSGRPDLVRQFFPLRVSGCGLCFSAVAAHLLSEAVPNEREVLRHRFDHGDCLREAAQSIGRTRGRIGQIVGDFMAAIDTALQRFPDEKHALWDAWQRCEPLGDLLGDELDATDKQTVAGALSRVFGTSEEGRAILKHRRALFTGWWRDVRRAADFYLGGLRVVRIVREKGEPHLLMPFLDFLEEKRGVNVCRTSGKATSSRTPLRRVVKAVLTEASEPMSCGDVLRCLHGAGRCLDLDQRRLARKMHHWAAFGCIPTGKVRLD